jgi:hypothetical protein
MKGYSGPGMFVAARPGKDTVIRTEALEAVREAMRLLQCAETSIQSGDRANGEIRRRSSRRTCDISAAALHLLPRTCALC